MTTKTTNEMIFATLKTKADKPAKYAEQLREMGYDVSNVRVYEEGGRAYDREYWAVNGLEMWKADNVVISLRGVYVEKLENIKRVDFEDYFAKLDGRKAKAELMKAHGSIEQRDRWSVSKHDVWVDADGSVHRWRFDCKDYRNAKKAQRRSRRHYFDDFNHTVIEYRNLKNKAEARGYGFSRDYAIKDAEEDIARAEKRVEELWKQLEQAEKVVERRKAALQKEIDKKAEGGAELDAWLKAKGIR